ncbi:hypothetical protein PHJA_001629400 [Phtheirospermum japonicum]|uniref:Uncharacterized protein n=1 Tax=Phtheirospermum japonicum TaxID=374723 RepID=A0A830C5E2_9LAMI|nr:hypothetical protein PHJA_001629400 [Phtheirospermum japonicum]
MDQQPNSESNASKRRAALYKSTNKDNRYSNHGTQFEFRRQLIAVLRKPYDKDEYNKLWEDIKFRKPEKLTSGFASWEG